uniref:TonB-dependent receptor n=1 Tax=Desulfobacca acetoxidans TaxID=60893 RepID=A0A7C5AMU6_9BACT
MFELRRLWWSAVLSGIMLGGALVPAAAPETASAPPRVMAESEAKAAEETARIEEPIFVTATKTPRHPDDIPASITVITSEDVARQNIQTADDALHQVPGVMVRRGKGWADKMTNVTIRGFAGTNQSRTLVLLDGLDVTTPYSNQFSWTSLAPEDIDRIEVVRGPFSALYGGNAMGGVINIITKMPQKLELTSGVGYGTYDSWTYYFSAGDRLWDRVSIKASYKCRYSSGYASDRVTRSASPGAAAIQTVGWQPTFTPTGSRTYIIGDPGDSTWYDASFGGKLSWDVAPGHKVNFQVQLAWNEYGYSAWHTYLRDGATGAPVFSGTVGLFGTGLRFTGLQESAFLSGDGREHTALYNFHTEHKLTDRTTLKFRAGLVNQPHNWYTLPGAGAKISGGPGSLSTSPSRVWNFEIQGEQALGSKQLWTAGLAYKTGAAWSKEFNLANWRNPDSKLDLTRFSQGRDRTLGFYLQDEINWHRKFSTIIGARLDWWQTYGGVYRASAKDPAICLPARSQASVNPKIAVLYRPWDFWSWRASAGTAFRAPNIYELYRTWRAPSGTLYQGNPNLKPERAMSWEIGTSLKPWASLVIAATFFDNHLHDLIYSVRDPADPAGRNQIRTNAAKARILGVELEAHQKLSSWLEVFANATLLDPRIRKNPANPASEGKNITFVPRQQFNFGLNARYWILNANLAGRYVSRLYARDDNSDTCKGVYGSYDPYFTLDGKLTATPVKHLQLSFAVNNMLNREYYLYNLTPGRTFWLEAALKY